MRTFLDSNVIVYSLDPRYPEKRAIARRLMSSERAFISTQAIAEVFWTLRKFKHMPDGYRYEQTRGLFDFEVVDVTSDVMHQALRLSESYQMSIWDAMILAAAKKAGCTHGYTEDLQSAEVIEGVRYVNPFAESGGPGGI